MNFNLKFSLLLNILIILILSDTVICGKKIIQKTLYIKNESEDYMKVTDMWKSSSKPTISFELFPARSPKGALNLEKAIDDLADLKPDLMSVTFGAEALHVKAPINWWTNSKTRRDWR